MPFGDKTGPKGLGPMTGRGRGPCASAGPAGMSGRYIGQTGAFGGGRGRGWRQRPLEAGAPARGAARGWYGSPRQVSWTVQDELSYLKDYTQGLEEALTAARTRMEELEKGGKTD